MVAMQYNYGSQPTVPAPRPEDQGAGLYRFLEPCGTGEEDRSCPHPASAFAVRLELLEDWIAGTCRIVVRAVRVFEILKPNVRRDGTRVSVI